MNAETPMTNEVRIPNEEIPSTNGVRPWYRIHLSTLSVVAIVLAWMVFINIPGDQIHDFWPRRFYHGWPYHYYERVGEEYSYWSFDQPTPWLGKPPRFDTQALLLNALTAICILALVACPCELWIRRNGRLFRFGTRSILAVTTIIAVIMGLVAREVRRCYRQQQAIRELEQVGSVTTNRSSQKYDWFRSFFGAELHGVVEGVDLVATEPVVRLPDLRLLENIKFFGMELANIPQNIEQLAELPKLEYLSVKLTSLGGADPKRLGDLTDFPELWRLCLVGDEFDDADIQNISRAARLGSLEIDSSKVTDAGLARISEMISLTNITVDESVLKTLDCSILTRLPKMYKLTFVGKKLAAQDAARLRSLWPNAKIEFGTTRDTWEPYITVRKE